ncbi:hypothetical protein ES708_27885 [subsurface metagenome]
MLAPWAKWFPLKVVSYIKKAGTSQEKAGPLPVIATIRSNILREICPRIIIAPKVIGLRKGRII